MDTKQINAQKRLAKKLTALRKTLRKDERDILDRLVAKQDTEVSGHVLLEGATESAAFLLENGAYAVLESTIE